MASDDADLELNRLVAGLLHDFAAVQTTKERRWGYKRAGDAIAALDRPLTSFLEPGGTLRRIANVGPASTKIVLEVLTTGTSNTVEDAIAAFRFLSHAQIADALADRTLAGPAVEDYRGDLQMHSVWSDGRQTLEQIVEAGLARGYRYSAVTDHSYGLPVARGVSMARLAQQHREIDALNARHGKRFRLLKGIEANIRSDGSVDMTPEELRQIEIVVAAPHSNLRAAADQTPRMVRAVSTPGVHILGHPRGRRGAARPGITAEWDRVFERAAATRVAVEIDGDPSRQDIDYELARRAAAAGCLFALDSDAHAVAELQYAHTAIAHARLAGIPADRVVNTWPLPKLLAWAAEAWNR
jgi:histidinol phosphatase-like PHP family hydrolase